MKFAFFRTILNPHDSTGGFLYTKRRRSLQPVIIVTLTFDKDRYKEEQ